MSSDSENDEFYDAVDVTLKLIEDEPIRQSLQSKEKISNPCNSEKLKVGKNEQCGEPVRMCELQSQFSSWGSDTDTTLFRPTYPVITAGPGLGKTARTKRIEASESGQVSHSGSRALLDDRRSLAEDSCSSLSGSLLGNLRDDEEPIILPTTRVSTARHRRRPAAATATTPPPSPPTLHGDGADPGLPSVVHPFRVVEPDASSVYSVAGSKSNKGAVTEAGFIQCPDGSNTAITASTASDACSTTTSVPNATDTFSSSIATHLLPATLPSHAAEERIEDNERQAPRLHTDYDDFRITPGEAGYIHKGPAPEQRVMSAGLVLSPEPDLVASTKVNLNMLGLAQVPVASAFSNGDRTPRNTGQLVAAAAAAASSAAVERLSGEDAGNLDGREASSHTEDPAARVAYSAVPYSSQSLPAPSQPPRAPLPPMSLARKHRSHPALLHISVVDPTRGVDHVGNVAGVRSKSAGVPTADVEAMFAKWYKTIGLGSGATNSVGDTARSLVPNEGLLNWLQETSVEETQEETAVSHNSLAMPPPVAPPRKRRRRHQTDEDSASTSSAYSQSSTSALPLALPHRRHHPENVSLTPDPPTTASSLASEGSCSVVATHPFIITTCPSPPSTPLSIPRPPREPFRLSAIAKRSSKFINTKKMVGLTGLMPTGHRRQGGKGALGSVEGRPDTASAGRGSDTISIGRRSLDIKAAIMGQFLVKDLVGRRSVSSTPERAQSPALTAAAQPTASQPKEDILSDQEILSQVSLLNLDTGVRVRLSDASSISPNPINPLSLQMMKLTNSRPCSGDDGDTDDNSSIASGSRDSDNDMAPQLGHVVRKKTVRMKKLLERRVGSAFLRAAKTITSRASDDKDVFADDAPTQRTGTFVKIKTAHGHKGPHEWDELLYVQEITGQHAGPVWCAKFSLCGRLLATAGQDQLLRVWVIKQAYNFFLDIRTKYNPDIKASPSPSEESLNPSSPDVSGSSSPPHLDPEDHGHAPFMPRPFCVYEGHSADLLDVAWSKNYFLLTSSMDKTVRLWHISRKECLCIFQHVDFVTAIAFHPKDDRYFISGSLDGKLRLWSIPEKRVVLWTEVEGDSFITAANFCQNGAYTVVGTYDGRCLFYTTNQLKYNTQFNVRSARGKNSKGKKITGIESLPGENKVLVTSNDSRIRLYGLDEHSEHCKYRGLTNLSSQIRASFSHDGKYIVAGSENQCIYIWKTHHDHAKFGATSRRDRNAYWEGVKAHSAVVTCALFSPHPELVFNFIEQQIQQQSGNSSAATASANTSNGADKQPKHDSLGSNKGYMLVSADFNGCIKVFLKKEKPKHSSLPASALL